MSEEKRFPLQPEKGVTPGPLSCSWSVAEKSYGAYALRFGRSQSLETLAKRGGFSWGEMDDQYPAWREEESEIARLRAENEALKDAMSECPDCDKLEAAVAKVAALTKELADAKNSKPNSHFECQGVAAGLRASCEDLTERLNNQLEKVEYLDKANAALTAKLASMAEVVEAAGRCRNSQAFKLSKEISYSEAWANLLDALSRLTAAPEKNTPCSFHAERGWNYEKCVADHLAQMAAPEGKPCRRAETGWCLTHNMMCGTNPGVECLSPNRHNNSAFPDGCPSCCPPSPGKGE